MTDGAPGGKQTTKRKSMKLGGGTRHNDEESGNASFEKEPLIAKRQLGTETSWDDDDWNDSGDWNGKKAQSMIAQPTYTMVSPRHGNRVGMRRMVAYITRGRLAILTIMAIFVVFGFSFSVGRGTRHGSTASFVEQQQQQQQEFAAFYADDSMELPSKAGGWTKMEYASGDGALADRLNTLVPEKTTVIDVIPEYFPNASPPPPEGYPPVIGSSDMQDQIQQQQKWGVSQQEIAEDVDDVEQVGDQYGDYNKEGKLPDATSGKIDSDDYSPNETSLSILPSKENPEGMSDRLADKGWGGEQKDATGELQQGEDLEDSNDYDAYGGFVQDDGSFWNDDDDEKQDDQSSKDNFTYDDYEPPLAYNENSDVGGIGNDDGENENDDSSASETTVEATIHVPPFAKSKPRSDNMTLVSSSTGAGTTSNDDDDQGNQNIDEETPFNVTSSKSKIENEAAIASDSSGSFRPPVKGGGETVVERKLNPGLNVASSSNSSSSESPVPKAKLNPRPSSQIKIQAPARGEGMPRTRDEVGDGSSSITNLPKEVWEDATPKNPLGDRLPSSSLPGNATDMRGESTASKLVKEDTTKNQTQSKPSVGLHKDAVKNSTKLNDLNAATASDSPPARVAARVKVNVGNVSTSLNTTEHTTPSTVGEPLVLSPAMGALVPKSAGVGTAAQNTTAQSTVSESAVISDAGANKQATDRVKEVRQVAKQKVVASVPVPATANGGTKGGTTPHPRSGKLEDDSGFIDVLPAATPDGSGHKANKDQATAEQMLPPAISDPTSIDTDVNSDVNSAPHQLPSKSSQSSPLVPPTEIATLQGKTPDSVNLATEPRKPRSPVQT